MVKIIITLVVLCFQTVAKSQMIKSFKCIESKLSQDSIFINYTFQLRLGSSLKKEARNTFIKTEMEKRYQIKPNDIVEIESFLGKRPNTYFYRVKVRKV